VTSGGGDWRLQLFHFRSKSVTLLSSGDLQHNSQFLVWTIRQKYASRPEQKKNSFN